MHSHHLTRETLAENVADLNISMIGKAESFEDLVYLVDVSRQAGKRLVVKHILAGSKETVEDVTLGDVNNRRGGEGCLKIINLHR